MSTTQTAALLFQLQLLDLELDRLNAEQQAIQTSLQGNPKLRRLRSEHESAQQQTQSGLQAQKEAEWVLEDIMNRLKVQEQRLYSGTAINHKDLQPLQQEVQRLQAQQNRQEETLLELIDIAESLQEEAQHKQAILKQAEEAWGQESATLLARRDQVDVRREDLQKKRSQAASGIESGLLTRYNTLRRTKQGRAVSRVEQNSCQWCRVILTPSELQQVRISSELQTCSNCGRILYYER
jgi:uncharacterized protein